MFDQKFQRSEAATAGAHRKLAGFLLLSVQHRAHAQRLQQSAPCNVLSQLLDTHPALIRRTLAFDATQPIERNVPRAH